MFILLDVVDVCLWERSVYQYRTEESEAAQFKYTGHKNINQTNQTRRKATIPLSSHGSPLPTAAIATSHRNGSSSTGSGRARTHTDKDGTKSKDTNPTRHANRHRIASHQSGGGGLMCPSRQPRDPSNPRAVNGAVTVAETTSTPRLD